MPTEDHYRTLAARYIENWQRWHAHRRAHDPVEHTQVWDLTDDQDARDRLQEAAEALEALFANERLMLALGGFSDGALPLLAATLTLWLQDLQAEAECGDDEAQGDQPK